MSKSQKDQDDHFEQLLKEHLDVMYRVAVRLAKDSDDAEDLVAEATVSAWKSFSRLRDKDKFKPWVLRIVTNTYINQYRRKQSRPAMVAYGNEDDHYEEFSLFDALSSPLILWNHNPEKIFLDNLLAKDITDAIHDLPLKYRVVVTLCLLEKQPYQQTAKIIGVPVGTVRSRLHRGKSILQKKLWEYGSQKSYQATEKPASKDKGGKK